MPAPQLGSVCAASREPVVSFRKTAACAPPKRNVLRSSNAGAAPGAGILAPMGKLAERYGDGARSGVYRVRDAAIPRAAAAEADALLVEVAAASLAAGGWRRIEQAIGMRKAGTCVVLVGDAAALAAPGHGHVLEALRAMAGASRAAGRPFFAVLVDPEARLALPPLYKEDGA